MKPSTDLSKRISRALCLVVGTVWVLCAAFVSWYVHKEVAQGFDAALIESSERLLGLVVHEIAEHHGGRLDLSNKASALPTEIPNTDAAQVEDDYLVYQVIGPSGQMLLRSGNAPEQMLPFNAKGGFEQTNAWRSYTLRHPSHDVWIVVADSVEHRPEALVHTSIWLIVPMIALLPMLVVLIHWIVKHELRSISVYSKELAARGGRNLSPLVVPDLPAELLPVLDSTNHLLVRLDEALKMERALAADVAHELRTPLASARLLLSTAAASEEMPAQSRQLMEQAMAGLEVLTRRTEKLLQLSRAESSSAMVQEPVLLNKVIAAVVDEFALGPHRLSWEPTDAPEVYAMADVDSLAIALRNLIENGLRHGQGALVTVRVFDEGQQACVAVLDEGPGVPVDDLERIRVRHVRAGSAGFGLGLSIVSGIVARQGGRLELHSPARGLPRGFEAVIVLRKAQKPA